MRFALFAFLTLSLGGQARAAPTLDLWSLLSPAGGYYASRAEVSAPVGPGYYSLSARVRTLRFQDGAPGAREEYSASLRRELYHVSVAGRLGTSPPGMQRAAYHMAQGEALFTFYGLALGPEHPEFSTAVWESSGPAPASESLGRTWVTTFRTLCTNTDIHLERPTSILVVVQNAWQFEVRETWRGRTSLALQAGGDRYNRVLTNQAETVYLDNVDYPGGPFAVRAWPNNYVAADIRQRLGAWRIGVAGTRLNVLDNGLVGQYGVELERSLGGHWTLRSGYYHKHRRRSDTRDGFTLNAVYAW